VPTRPLTRRDALALGAGAAAVAFERSLPAAFASGGSWRTLPVVRARFDLVGVRWARGTVSAVEIRARRRGGSWSAWTALGMHAPDAGGAKRVSDPAWTGPSDFVQVRFRGTASGLRARFVRVGVRARSSARTQAQAGPPGAPPIIARSAWGGDGRPPKADPSYGEVQVAFIHHTVTANDYAPEDSPSIVLGICEYHQDHNKWNDIGYNFLVDKYGQVFEGRAGGVEQAVIGAQAQGYNSVSTGVASLGDFSTLPQSDAGIEALAKLIAWKLPLHGVPVTGSVVVTSAGGAANRYPSGTAVTLERISGHRDGNNTACPGDTLYGQLQRIRDRAAALAVPVSVLSARAAVSTVRGSSPVGLSGSLRFSDGAAPGGAAIQIQHQAAGGAWAQIGSAVAAGDGSWTASLPVPGTGLVRAVFPGDASHPPLEAAAVAITVLPRVTMKLAARRVSMGSRVAVTGTIGPAWPPKVALVLEIRRGTRWVPVQRKRINVRAGGFASYVRPVRPGLYRVSIEAPGAVVRRQLRVASVTGGASA
jgi:hypothetical protein